MGAHGVMTEGGAARVGSITPRISVAMSVHNNERFVGAAIDSILAQSFGDFEFLIVDDGSRDRSAEIISHYAASDVRIRFIRQENRGLIASLNRLIEEARAPLIARMDGDDIALPDRFARQIAFLDAHPDHGVVGTHSYDIDEEGHRLALLDARPLDHDAIAAMLERASPLCHPSVMMRRDVVRRAGGYHPAFLHCEDYDLWLRMATFTRLANLPDRLLLYRRSAGQISTRHRIAQTTGAVIAQAAYRERRAGRLDPTSQLSALPPIAELDAVFGRAGVSQEVREAVARNLLWSREAMGGAGFDLLVDHVRDGGARTGLWRTVARLVAFGEPRRALRLAGLLIVAAARFRPSSR